MLTHTAAADGWSGSQVLPTYVSEQPDAAAPPPDVSHVYWHSAAQYAHWHAQLPAGVHHACGQGKTAERLRPAGLASLTVFPSAHEWRQWLNT